MGCRSSPGLLAEWGWPAKVCNSVKTKNIEQGRVGVEGSPLKLNRHNPTGHVNEAAVARLRRSKLVGHLASGGDVAQVGDQGWAIAKIYAVA
jgi:hypothetical protein